MLNYVAIILGLLSWGTLVYAIVKRERLTTEKLSKLRLQAWILCAISIYIPSIILSVWVEEENITNLLDCTFGYHFGASVLLGVTVVLTIVSVAIMACASNDKAFIHNNSEGSYHAQGISKEVSIKFDLEDKTFVMNFEITSSMIVIGNIEVNENQIIAIAESGLEKYVFDIVDKETISFVEKESTGNILWEDGTQFTFRASREK